MCCGLVSSFVQRLCTGAGTCPTGGTYPSCTGTAICPPGSSVCLNPTGSYTCCNTCGRVGPLGCSVCSQTTYATCNVFWNGSGCTVATN